MDLDEIFQSWESVISDTSYYAYARQLQNQLFATHFPSDTGSPPPLEDPPLFYIVIRKSILAGNDYIPWAYFLCHPFGDLLSISITRQGNHCNIYIGFSHMLEAYNAARAFPSFIGNQVLWVGMPTSQYF